MSSSSSSSSSVSSGYLQEAYQGPASPIPISSPMTQAHIAHLTSHPMVRFPAAPVASAAMGRTFGGFGKTGVIMGLASLASTSSSSIMASSAQSNSSRPSLTVHIDRSTAARITKWVSAIPSSASSDSDDPSLPTTRSNSFGSSIGRPSPPLQTPAEFVFGEPAVRTGSTESVVPAVLTTEKATTSPAKASKKAKFYLDGSEDEEEEEEEEMSAVEMGEMVAVGKVGLKRSLAAVDLKSLAL